MRINISRDAEHRQYRDIQPSHQRLHGLDNCVIAIMHQLLLRSTLGVMLSVVKVSGNT